MKGIFVDELGTDWAYTIRVWQRGGDNWGCLFLTLIGKSDREHREMLRKANSVAVDAYESWYNSPSEKQWFKDHL